MVFGVQILSDWSSCCFEATGESGQELQTGQRPCRNTARTISGTMSAWHEGGIWMTDDTTRHATKMAKKKAARGQDHGHQER